MAELKLIQNVDKKLIEDGIIDKKYQSDYAIVHKKMNTIIRKTGKILSEDVFQKGESEMRKWLATLHKKGASQEKLTSYLRCALAHLCSDFIESTYRQISTEDLTARTLVSFKKRRFNTGFFKAAASMKKTGKKAVKKNTAKSKSSKKVTKKIKAVKKKVIKKSPAKKTKKGILSKIKKILG